MSKGLTCAKVVVGDKDERKWTENSCPYMYIVFALCNTLHMIRYARFPYLYKPLNVRRLCDTTRYSIPASI